MLDRVLKTVETWRPRKCKTEKDFEVSLKKHLEKNLGKSEIIKQYAVGRIRGDIVIDKKILIEIKKNLDSMSPYQRLKGQIDDYGNQWDGYVIIVFCGHVERDLKRQIEKQATSYKKMGFWSGPFGEQKIHIRYKGSASKMSGGEEENVFGTLLRPFRGG